MTLTMYKALAGLWRRSFHEPLESIMRSRMIEWRRQPTVVRVDKPTKLHTARKLGYKAKRGFIVVRVRIRKGSGEKARPRSGRRPKALGVKKIKREISKEEIAVYRAQRKYPNLKPIGSYYVYEDGVYEWYEVIMVDPMIVLRDSRTSVQLPGPMARRFARRIEELNSSPE
jgi:large subunit ribosomal protein L15e